MVISKILNNNVIVSCASNGNEIIAMGKGIAYKKKCGEVIEDGLIDKVYTLSNKDISNKFQELLSNIPIEYLNISNEIIEYAKVTLGKNLNDSIYISLTDHLGTSIERAKNKIFVRNAMLWEIKRFYKEEYKIGLKVLDKIKEKFDIELPEDEAGFIALHIVNAQLDETISVVYDITKVMQEVANIVKYHFGITFDENSVYYYRFITHLKFFAQRLFNKNEYKGQDNDSLMELIKSKYEDAYACVQKVTDFIKNKYSYDLSEDEQLYLTIHIARIVEETK